VTFASTFTTTWRALAEPRRALPLAAVIATLLIVEGLATRSVQAVLLDLLLFVAFVAFVPALHRYLEPRGRVGLLLYVAIGAGMVLGFGGLIAAIDALAFTYVIDPAALGAIAVLFLVGGWGLSRDLALEERAEVSELQARANAAEARANALQAAAHAMEAERRALLALRAQLDPHFLFNTLNAIAEWCREDPLIAEKATLELASMLRAMLEGARAPSWPIATELDLLRRLTVLYGIRDPDRYRFRIELTEPLPSLAVPPMLLLPLLENAITHGPAAGHAGEVVISVSATSDGARITMTNPGAYAGRREGGHGIDMVEKRLVLAYGERASFSIEAVDAQTLATVLLPTSITPEPT
jgi:signal transduction histidine kinase